MLRSFARRYWPALDVLGGVLSIACAVHCVAMPLLILALPLLGGEVFDRGLSIALGSVAIVAIGGGALMHGRLAALVPMTLGLGALGVAHTLGADTRLGLFWSIAASALLVTAHWLNARTCRSACEANAA